MRFRMAGKDKKASRHFFCLLFIYLKKSSLLLFCKTLLFKGFTTFLPVCKKHTRDAEIRPFCPGFCVTCIQEPLITILGNIRKYH